MKTYLTLLLATLCAASSYAQTIKALGYNTTNGAVVYTGTNAPAFTNGMLIVGEADSERVEITPYGIASPSFGGAINFEEGSFQEDSAFDIKVPELRVEASVEFIGTNASANAAATRTNLGLGANNIVTFAGLTNNGDITINQTATNNGLLYIRRTNNEPFLGLANLIASNNTTISNETLFRVGTAEATNRSAQFGFRSTNTNGSGVAVFSVFGYNALAMIGPSARSATNTNGIEADIYSINPTNKVATLIDTNTGATLMHRPVGFTTNASTPSSTNTIVGWIELFVGTNSVRVPYYQ
jgi:hypothetical protein